VVSRKLSCLPPRPRVALRSGRAISVVIVVVLIALIAGAVWVAYLGLTTENSGRERRSKQEMGFKCDRCGHEFVMTPLEFADQASKEFLTDSTRGKPNCPGCGQKLCATQMVKCSECGKYYLAGRGEDGQPEYVCTHCGQQTNFQKAGRRRRDR
jgi:DNA-directed RNA polymerase subunit RPC12/RpoP